MPTYLYEGRNAAGEKISGSLDANSTEDVARFLDDRGITPINIDVAKTKNRGLTSYFEHFFPKKIKQSELLFFARQMYTLIAAGVPIVNAVKQLSRSSRSTVMAEALLGVAYGLESGKSLADSLREYTNIFPNVFISIIEVGENTGHLDDAFLQLSGFVETRIANRRRLASAVRYPMIVLIAIGIAIAIMNILVLPKFSALFSRFNTQLPLPTKILMAFSNFLYNHWLLMLLVLLALILSAKLLLQNPKYKLLWDRYKLRFPVLGDLQQRIILSQFSWTFGMILHAGVSVLKGVALAASGTDNFYIKQQLLKIRDSIEHGESFAKAAAYTGLFTPGVLQMIDVGENTGNLDTMLSKVAAAYDSDLDYDIKRLNDLIEPLVLALVGVMVVILALAIYLPMWDLIKVVK